jgi:hypothetical protein
LIVEIAAVFILNKPWSEAVLTIFSTLFILVGVWGEIILEKRSKESGDKLVTAALNRAAKAQEELTSFRTERHELLTTKAKESIKRKIKPFANTPFCVAHDRVNTEQWDFMWHLEPVIADAGWRHVDWVWRIVPF